MRTLGSSLTLTKFRVLVRIKDEQQDKTHHARNTGWEMDTMRVLSWIHDVYSYVSHFPGQ